MKALPLEIGQSNGILKELDLSNNMLSVLPKELSLCVKLQTLTLNANLFTFFDTEIYLSMPSLEYLYMASNQIARFTGDSNLWAQSNIKVLDLQGNQISHEQIPTQLLKESKVHNLNLNGNKVRKA